MPAERARLEAAEGPWAVAERIKPGADGKDRTLGRLAVSRALGDAVQEGGAGNVLVSCVPEFRETRLGADAAFLILGSDGVFEVRRGARAPRPAGARSRCPALPCTEQCGLRAVARQRDGRRDCEPTQERRALRQGHRPVPPRRR